MEIALVEGQRHLAEPGLPGVCQFCGRDMVAKCGEQIIWHWAHKGRKQCDPWWENEGPWHRAWKTLFPPEFHEQVRFDATGEKHIADVLLPNGLVVELQHSAMPLDEMHSREGFYDRMVWIVDASPFMQNITLFDPLPDPTISEVADLRFCPAHPLWRQPPRRVIRGYDGLMFYRESSRKPGDTMVHLLSGRDMGFEFATTHVGHYLALWMRPREVWLSTSRPTFLDFGNGWLGRLMYYPPVESRVLCVQLVQQAALIEHLYVWPDQVSK